MQYSRHLPLRSVYNTRDLGGYATKDGFTTRFGIFLRSDAPCEMLDEDIAALQSYGLTASMDLRSDNERLARPSSLHNVAVYYECPLFAKAAVYGKQPPPKKDENWLEKYIEMAESAREWAVRVLNIAAQESGCLLYHCTTGKDRTGLLSCYLLSIAGVSREDIAADYCVSELYLEPVYQRLRAGALPLDQNPDRMPPPFRDDSFFRTPASAMLGLIDYFDTNYGGVVPFLKLCGVSRGTMDQIHKKFLHS